ncbi:uncharacterized protein LOC133175097 isoform X3 [Saccostrea echinata]|uniref:uncharacterized protein LOC133175097 isoform X3 n=1 Tax=Saccostrea echinata TaxID=191078 RepID=UPI002A819286|nr:uncharacterized protein LOC133175097 isoform X3 [Saccostrea echinata]
MAGFVKKCPCLKPKIQEEIYELDYRHCNLTDVPAQVFNFERTLEELYLDNNQIQDLPRELFCCHGIRKLCLSNNEVTNIPPAIGSLINLEELDISKNGIIDIPENINCCKCLRSVNANVNPLGKLPEGLTQLGNLTQLYLNDTFLDYLPGTFGRLLKLKVLEIRENHLKTLPKSFSMLTSLERLDIGHNEFTELPDVIGNLTSLLELWCDHNQITTLTSTIGNLKRLMFLDASSNHLQSIPSEIEGCSSLGDLHLTTNRIQALPESLGNLESLTTLKIDNNQLTSLPTSIGGLQSLSELNVSCNNLEELPASLGLLRNLRTFYADENDLLFIPAEVGSCNGITVLSLRSNHLEYIPDEIGRIPRLRVLNLSDNRLKYLPFTITKLKDLQALWLAENQTCPLIPLQSDHDPDNGRKILTCYLLPQLGDDDRPCDSGQGGDTDSFHASMWDEERSRRQTIHFAFPEEDEEEGTLVRCPTPYPKDMREKIRHARNMAMRQKLSGGPADVRWNGGRDNKGYEEETTALVYDNHGDGDLNRHPRPASPIDAHRLYQCDKEKLAKDKARLQRHHSDQESEREATRSRSPIGEVATAYKPQPAPRKGYTSKEKNKRSQQDDGGFSEKGPMTCMGSNTDISTMKDLSAPNTPVSKRTPAFSYCSPSELSSRLSQFSDPRSPNGYSSYSASPSGKSHRTRDYDSDTGYRSESEFVRLQRQQMYNQQGFVRGGYESDRDGLTPRKERQREVGYSSDVEGYSGRVKMASYHSGPTPLQQQNSGSVQYQRNQSKPSPIYSSTNQNWTSQKVQGVSNSAPSDKMSDPSARSLETSGFSDSGYNPPSPMFHHSKIVDQSTPVTSEAPHGFRFTGRSRSGSDSGSASQEEQGKDWRKDFYAVMEQKMNSSQTHLNQQVNETASKDQSHQNKASPTYTSVSHRKLPPTPNRNSPYGVMNYDRRNANSPSMYQRISELAITENVVQNHRSESPYQRLPLSRQSPNQQLYRQSETLYRQEVSSSPHQKTYRQSDTLYTQEMTRQSPSQKIYQKSETLYTQEVTQIPNSSGEGSMSVPPSHPLVPSSANSVYPHDHDSSQSSGFSSDTSKSRPYNPLPPKLPQVSSDRPQGERSRTPVFVNCEEERGDSPRESGYSSREHSSHRNSPCDTIFPQGQYTEQGEDYKNPGSSCEDIASYKHNLQMSQARVPRLVENSPRVYKDMSTKYSGFTMPPPSRPPPSPYSSQLPVSSDHYPHNSIHQSHNSTPYHQGNHSMARETTSDHPPQLQQGPPLHQGVSMTAGNIQPTYTIPKGGSVPQVKSQNFTAVNPVEPNLQTPCILGTI